MPAFCISFSAKLRTIIILTNRSILSTKLQSGIFRPDQQYLWYWVSQAKANWCVDGVSQFARPTCTVDRFSASLSRASGLGKLTTCTVGRGTWLKEGEGWAHSPLQLATPSFWLHLFRLLCFSTIMKVYPYILWVTAFTLWPLYCCCVCCVTNWRQLAESQSQATDWNEKAFSLKTKLNCWISPCWPTSPQDVGSFFVLRAAVWLDDSPDLRKVS